MCWGLRAWERSNWLIEGLFQPRIPLKGQKKKASVIGCSEPTAEGWTLQAGQAAWGSAENETPVVSHARAPVTLSSPLGSLTLCRAAGHDNRVGPVTLLAPPSLPRKGMWSELRENTFRNIQPLMRAAHPEWQAAAAPGSAQNQGQLGPLCMDCRLPAHGPWPPRYPSTTHTHTHTHTHTRPPHYLPTTRTHTHTRPPHYPPTIHTCMHTHRHTHTLTHTYTLPPDSSLALTLELPPFPSWIIFKIRLLERREGLNIWGKSFSSAAASLGGLSSVQLLSQVWLCAHMDFSTPDFPVHHQLPEPAQTHGRTHSTLKRWDCVVIKKLAQMLKPHTISQNSTRTQMGWWVEMSWAPPQAAWLRLCQWLQPWPDPSAILGAGGNSYADPGAVKRWQNSKTPQMVLSPLVTEIQPH